MHRFQVRDTVLLSGWLFSDLLLGLAIIFFVSLPGAQRPPSPILKWNITPTSLAPTSSHCTGGLTAPSCTVVLSETADSQESLHWTASSDMSDSVAFSQGSGVLQPGQSITIALSTFPCQNGSFTFTGPASVNPLTVSWRCTPLPVRLEKQFKEFSLNVNDVNGLLSSSQSEINDIEQQIRNQPVLQNRSVGLAIVYGGAPTDGDIQTALQIANKVYSILADLGQKKFAFQRSSYYGSLFTLGGSPNVVKVDVYLYQM